MHEFMFLTDLGWFGVAVQDEALRAVTIGHHSQASALASLRDRLAEPSVAKTESSKLGQSLRERLEAYASGEAVDFSDVELDLAGSSPFRRRVIRACRAIPYGEVQTYRQLATVAGSLGAARAVGGTMAANRFPIVVPCHRVVASNGRLGGFSAPEGLKLKSRMLKLEGAAIGAAVAMP